MNKICADCKISPSLPPLPSGRNRYYCRLCERKQSNALYARYREIRGASYSARAYENKQLLIAAKNKPCLDCGNSFPSYCMDFDHRDQHTKYKLVSRLVNASTEKLLAEIEKCDVVCANCHRIRTFTKNQHKNQVILNRPKKVVILPRLSKETKAELCKIINDPCFSSDRERARHLATIWGITESAATSRVARARKRL